MKRIWVYVLAILGTTACQRDSAGALSQYQSARRLFGGADSAALFWRLTSIMDPYQGGTHIEVDSAEGRYLVMTPEGGFREYDAHNTSWGRWLLDREGQRLALVYEQSNGVAIRPAERDSSFRYAILRRSADSLVLGIQGRHGIVEHAYVRWQPARSKQP